MSTLELPTDLLTRVHQIVDSRWEQHLSTSERVLYPAIVSYMSARDVRPTYEALAAHHFATTVVEWRSGPDMSEKIRVFHPLGTKLSVSLKENL